jgi:hypothetical protein
MLIPRDSDLSSDPRGSESFSNSYSFNQSFMSSSSSKRSGKEVIISGWLLKRSQWLKQWRKRYAKIVGHCLFLSTGEQKKFYQKLDLADFNIVRSADETTGRENTFELVGSHVRKLTFQAETFDEKEEWMEKLGVILDCYTSGKSIKNVIGKMFIVLDNNRLYRVHDGDMRKLQEVEVPILTKQQRKCLLLPAYKNKPFEIKDSSSKKPLILFRGDDGGVIFLPGW